MLPQALPSVAGDALPLLRDARTEPKHEGGVESSDQLSSIAFLNKIILRRQIGSMIDSIKITRRITQ